MISNQFVESITIGHTNELVFAGDGVRLAGQIDYPRLLSSRRRPRTRFPLLFILHHAGSDDRSGYAHFAQLGLESGFAVFRWDKRGTGSSGAGGRGSTTQDAVNAYEIALEQPGIDHNCVVILAQDAGTRLLGDSFGLFARVQAPRGVILATNTLNETAVLAIESRLLVVVGQHDWNPWQRYGKAAANAHNILYHSGAAYYAAPHANRMLVDTRTGTFHFGARNVILDWLQSL